MAKGIEWSITAASHEMSEVRFHRHANATSRFAMDEWNLI